MRHLTIIVAVLLVASLAAAQERKRPDPEVIQDKFVPGRIHPNLLWAQEYKVERLIPWPRVWDLLYSHIMLPLIRDLLGG
jgi:hypothetical protein